MLIHFHLKLLQIDWKLDDEQIDGNIPPLRLDKFRLGCFPFNQKFQKLRSEFKWKGPFHSFVLTGMFRSTSGGGPF